MAALSNNPQDFKTILKKKIPFAMKYKLNIKKTFRGRLGRLLKVLYDVKCSRMDQVKLAEDSRLKN